MSASPFPLRPGRRLALMPAYLGSVDRFAAMAACAGSVTVMSGIPFDKRLKGIHRCPIASTRGAMTLTVPVAKPISATASRWSDITVSPHGEWWRLHLTALESAYGRTPFFEFYIDRFMPFYSAFEPRPVVLLDEMMERVVCDILGIPAPAYDHTLRADPRGLDRPAFDPLPYWQLRAGRLGFIPGMSILDLIFNLGPEAPLYLARLAQS